MRVLVSVLVLASSMWTWLQRLGGPGLIVLGVVDNSAIPLPGSMDLLVILLSAHHRQWWPYYAAMATVGAVAGGYLTYRLAEKGGEETLEKKVGKQRAEKVYRRFKKHGFATVAVGAMLPPPFPIVPFLLAAGALKYPQRNFIAALATGRAARFVAVAYLAHRYGQGIIGWVSRYYHPLLYTLIGLGVLGGIAALLYWKWYRPRHQKPAKHSMPVTKLSKPAETPKKRKRA
jgi:membrane protein YqaA with SNARE-associated domain